MRFVRLIASLAPLAALVSLTSGVGAAPPVPPPRYLPLDLDNHWAYVSEERPDPLFAREVTVVEREGDLVKVAYGEDIVTLRDVFNAPEIETGDAGFKTFYLFDELTFLHHDFQDCEDERTMLIASRDDVVETPLDIYHGCLRIEYQDSGVCADAGRAVEWWAPEVGLVKWSEQSFIGPRSWVLSVFNQEKPQLPFRRGEVDGSGDVDLSDAVNVLNWLFLGGTTPPCQDAADANDDGGVDLSDAVSILAFLFLGGDEPSTPGPLTCGKDPSPDALPRCELENCKSSGEEV